MAYFHLKLVPPRTTFPFDMTDAEREAMGRHAQYWRDLAEKGTAIAVGPVFAEEGAFGLAIVEADSLETVQAIADADPVIKADLGLHFVASGMPSIILRQN